MKWISLLLLLFIFSCEEKTKHLDAIILEDDSINIHVIESLNVAERMLLSGYLFAYGNECTLQTDSSKCELLDALNIEDECEDAHKSDLSDWFSEVILIKFKLKNCPSLPFDNATQNSFEKIILKREGNIISINYHIKGVNESQEKNWDLNHTDTYRIVKGKFIKI